MSIAQSLRNERILVVDDSPDNLFLIQITLEADGYEIRLAEDGSSALTQIEQFLPDVILLDVMMPEMDGYEVTERIRQNQKIPYIPILLITADQRSSVVKGLDVGADDFIRKPVDVDELLARVRSLLRLKRSIDEREQLARQREDFVSRLTHDLRTPLVAADRVLNLLHHDAFGSISEETRDVVDNLIRSNGNLLQLVNTLLEVYRHESGHKSLDLAICDLADIADQVAQELKPLAHEKGLALTVNIDPTYSIRMVKGDRLELHRVITNLVGNAIKFTDTGLVTVVITGAEDRQSVAYDDQESPIWVTLDVKDTGTGIALKEQADLFERFHQGGHKRAGSGLGLYLSRRIIESHQGTIEVRSQPGQGSVFTVRLPAYY